ncbi:hypothetical protein [Brachyspira aalborgi]|jgi:hypothetical protein|uniref:Viral A-type inclusion protein n=1 Tax=Brachyspira aalborgi TaxID=29522 RepID=A0ABY3K9N6_9SPIR|nr:hypothetical protein [Brachyspira aalborgi]TXJ32761.1 hypothetical protein EPJ71_04235 [Brachyspira aalborgi]TXJ40967.1 hypothetical protein EPJ65_10405 [Brachyspira aalborgi]
MKKDFESVFDKNISIDEYKLDNLLNKNIEINEKEFPAILIDNNDDINKYININNINSNEIVDKQNETIENNAINETENIADNENNSNDAYTEEENNLYGDLEESVALKDSDLIGIEDIDDFNLENAVFENKKNNESEEIYKNNSENSNIENNEELNNIEKEFEKSDYDKVKEIDLIEEDNLKKENEILEYNDKEVIVPSIDSIDYIDESNYINESDIEDEIIELSGNELDLITKDNDISEDINYSVSISEMDNEKKNNENEENIIKVSDENMRKDNFLLEEQPIENSSENINAEEEEQKRTDYYINKYKKLHEDYIKSIEEENNKIKEEDKQEELNDKLISKEKEEETKSDNEIIENITEDIKEEDKTDYYINKYKKLHEDYIKSIEEENNKIKEENKQEEIIENKIENIETPKENIAPVIEEAIQENIEYKSALNDLDILDKLSSEEEEMYKNYLGEDLNLVENENDTKEEEIKKNDNEIIENITEDIKEEDKTNYYINKYKKLHEDYIKSIEEENNKIKEENKQEEIIENKIENIETLKENVAPVIEEEIQENIEDKSALNDLDISDKLSAEEEEMYKNYLGEDLNLIEDTGDLIIEEEILEENIENEFPLNNLEITDKLSVEEEEMYKAYLGEDLELIDDIEDSENIAKSLMDEYKKEMLSNKVEISGELSEEEENIVDDILKKNKNQYYEDTIDYDSIILKELNLNEIEEIDENDFNILENFILGKEQEKGIELISINNENILKKNDFNVNNDSKSVDSFDSIDDDELLKVKENTMSEEKELYESEKKNIDLNVKVEEEFSLNKDDNESVLISEQVNKSNSKDDFDGEITQMDLDLAEKLFENEDQLNNEEYSLKHDLLLSESDIGKFRKLFSYFKNIVDKLPQDNLNEFSKTEFYDIYSALFRKFGE